MTHISREVSPWWIEAATGSPDGRVLYLGCGDGRHAGPLAAHCGELIGVDEDPEAIERFTDRVEAEGQGNVRLVTAPVHALELREDFGLVVVPASLINGVEDPAIRGGIVKRAATHCRGDGRVLLRVLNPHWLALGMPVTDGDGSLELGQLEGDAWEQRYRARLTHRLGDGSEYHETVDAVALFPRELRALAYQSGLEVVRTWGDRPGESALGVEGAAWHLLCTPAT